MSDVEHKYVRHSIIGFVLWRKCDDIAHATVGHCLRGEAGGTILSAGFCCVSDGAVTCWGRSESLSIGGRPDDETALARQLGIGGAP